MPGGFLPLFRAFTLVGLLAAVVSLPAFAATFEEISAGAAAARRSNHIPEAIALYKQGVDQRGTWLEGWWFLGTLSYASFQYTDAETAFGEFVKLDGKRALAWSLLGLCEFETGKYERSLEHLRTGLAGGKDLPPEVEAGVRFHYGLLLTRAGMFDQGKRELARYSKGGASEPMLVAALGLNGLRDARLPKDVPAREMAPVTAAGEGVRLWILGDNEAAEERFRELVRKYPDQPGVHYLVGSYLSYLRPVEAMVELRRELAVNPANAGAAATLALLLAHANDVAGALPLAKKAATDKPADAVAEYAYGEVLMRAGEMRAAIARLEAAEKLDPEAMEYHMALASAYSRVGRHEEARRERVVSLEMAGSGGPVLSARSGESR